MWSRRGIRFGAGISVCPTACIIAARISLALVWLGVILEQHFPDVSI